jgi:16S rRNA C967 or C1407 C5-methylase (RsmB/RsmF family)/NOL1/NOP2/fmu family ribosome biogenesis protein
VADFPAEFLERARGQLGADFSAFRMALDASPPACVRLNARKVSGALGLPPAEEVPWCAAGRYLAERPVFTLDPLFHAGAYYPQEASSQLVGWAARRVLDFGGPLRVLDLCAAPGGKATLLADLLNDDSLLVANEAIRSRVPPLRENLTRWGWPNVLIANRDPEALSPLAGFFDLVLVDAPCSGEGLFRKDADAAGHWSPEAAGRCALRQGRILSAARALVRPGGALVYSTCTFNPEENDGAVGRFLAEAGEYAPLPLAFPAAWGVSATRYGGQCWPHRVRGEGFYLAVLRRDGYDARLPPRPNGTGSLRDEAARWLESPEGFAPFSILRNRPGGSGGRDEKEATDYALPRPVSGDAEWVCRTVGASPVLTLGAMKGRGAFVPDHALALTTAARRDAPRVELDRATALRYLKKEPFDLPEGASPGWSVATRAGLALGWLKVLPDRYNNYLPNEWRIRMALE